ncbi:MAG: DUF4147 domain-containing protein [Deltaproteobacteria bacterium]
MPSRSQSSPRRLLDGIYRSALRACDGERLAEASLRAAPPRGQVALLVLGKPSGALAAGAVRALGDALVCGWVVGPQGIAASPPLEAIEGGHPSPDRRSLAAGRALLDGLSRLPPGLELLAFVAGGGSALAVAPAVGLRAQAKLGAHRALVESSLPIEEVNIVRAHLSRLKGGGLLRASGPRRVDVRILSDVGRGALASVASGPFSPDPSSFGDCLALVRGVRGFPLEARRYLLAGANGRQPETLKPNDPLLRRRRQRLLASPLTLGRAAAAAGEELGLAVRLTPQPMVGPIERVADQVARWLTEETSGATLDVSVAEPTLVVGPRAGTGGRAQQLALMVAPHLRGRRAALLVAGSDGRDAASPFAGAIVDGTTAERAARLGLSLERALAHRAASPVIARLGVGIPAFTSGTNLTDLVLLWRG